VEPGSRITAFCRLNRIPPHCACDTLAENRKSASITIRLSKPECAQIHQRAASAGLTVLAYLRSCVLEAESLRAQVKENTRAALLGHTCCHTQSPTICPEASCIQRRIPVPGSFRAGTGCVAASTPNPSPLISFHFQHQAL
jgi:hypothetical protein